MTSAGETSDDRYGKLVKPLSELSVHEVGIVLEALKLGKYKETLINNEIDGECLMKCNTVEDLVNMGIKIFVKAHVFLDKVMTWKAKGVPKEYFSVYRVDNDAEVMIAELTKGSYCKTQLSSRTEPLSFVGSLIDNHDDRKTNDDNYDDDSVTAFVDSEGIQRDAVSNGNDHEGSVVDDTSIIEPVVKDDVTDEK